uniref:Uncharacterized protein n=1 Tax=Anopheles epiroticus TaxID=199890 RepID=A0A182P161_9DIPT
MIWFQSNLINTSTVNSNRKLNDLSYAFGYSINNAETNDIKSQQEQRLGDAVVGTYSLLDPDGYNRTVVYKVDGDKGFQAQVIRLPVVKQKDIRETTSTTSVKHHVPKVLGLVALVFGQNHYSAHNDAQHDVVHYHHDEEHHGPAHYEYHYDVHDDHTGDVHGQHEARKDDSTHGEYYLIDADGHKRTIILALALIPAVCGQSHYGHQQHYQPQHYHHEEEHHGPVHYEYH